MKDWNGDTIWYAVYGVFQKEKCLYVGSTKNTFDREYAQKRRFGRRIEFRVLKWCLSKSMAAELESKFIHHYKKMKQAKHNISIGF